MKTDTTPMAMVTRPRTVEFAQREIPSHLSGDEVLIEVKACAICGSDLHIFHDRHPFVSLPSAIGHEISGTVIETGETVRRLQKGNLVAVEPVIVCGRCEACLRGRYHLCENIRFQYREGQGGFSRYFVARERWLHPVPDGIDPDLAALAEPLAVALHAIDKASLKTGDPVCIFGDGPIGLLLAAVLRVTLTDQILLVGHRENRLEMAPELGAAHLFNGRAASSEEIQSRILEETEGQGVRTVFEAVGSGTVIREALQVLGKGGAAVLLGLHEKTMVAIDLNLMIRKELHVRGTQGYCWNFPYALKLLKSHPRLFATLITHVYPLAELQKAFKLLSRREEKTGKILIHPE